MAAKQNLRYLQYRGCPAVLIVPAAGEAESSALLRELNKQRQARPLTHDLMKGMLQELGYRVTKARCSAAVGWLWN